MATHRGHHVRVHVHIGNKAGGSSSTAQQDIKAGKLPKRGRKKGRRGGKRKMSAKQAMYFGKGAARGRGRKSAGRRRSSSRGGMGGMKM